MIGNIKDLTGETFGKLKVIGLAGTRDSRSLWDCLCECGNTKQVLSNVLHNHHTTSCGCWRKNRFKLTGDKSNRFEGIGQLSGYRVSRIKYRAKKAGFEYALTKEFLWNLWLEQGGLCKLSGLPITLTTGSSSQQGSASLDRIDSSKGYVESNVQWVHKHINFMKSDHTSSYFVYLCDMIAQHAKKGSK